MPSTSFFIPDSSSLFAYSPCTDCASGWTASYAARGDGYDQTFHQTSVSASVSLNISASSLSFVTSSSVSSSCASQYSINGSSFAPTCNDTLLAALPDGVHEVVLQPAINGSSFEFFGISGTFPLSSDNSYTNITIDNLSPSFTYSAGWSQLSATGVLGTSANASAVNTFSSLDDFYNTSVAVTTVHGASVNMTFQAEGIYLFGMSGLQGGGAEVWVDGMMMNTLNLSNPWSSYSSLLYVAGGLNASEEHVISVVNTSPGMQLTIDYALLTRPASSSGTAHLALILGSVSGAVAFLLVLSVLLYLYFTRRRTPYRSPAHPYGFATGLSHKDFGSKASSIDTWRKRTDTSQGATSPITPLSFSYTARRESVPTFGDVLVGSGRGGRGSDLGSGSGSGGTRPSPFGQPYDSPPPDYPDYIPYRGPVETAPPRDQPESPPAIAGGSASAASWLQARAASPNPSQGSNSSGSSRSGQSGRAHRPPRPPPLAMTHSRDRLHPESFAMDSYPSNDRNSGAYSYGRGARQRDSTQQPPLSSVSSETSGSIALVHVSTRKAVEATRSVARLWPSRAAVPSDFLSSMHQSGTNANGDAAKGPGIELGQGLALGSSVQTTDGGTFTLSQGQSLTTTPSLTPDISGSNHLAFLRSPPSTSSPGVHRSPSSSGGSSPVRRGVSIKSVKTVRSFFSGLLSSGPIPPTPSVQNIQAARPDSDIFPSSLSRSGSTSGYPWALGAGNVSSGTKGRGGAGGLARLGSISEAQRKGGRVGGRGSGGPAPLRLDDVEGGNWFIELNPNSPMTVVSRPGSEMTAWRG